MSPTIIVAVLRVFRVVFSAYRQAQEAMVPDEEIENERAWRHNFAVNLIAESMSALERRLGRDIVHDTKFKAAVDLLLTAIRLIVESCLRHAPPASV